MPENKHAHSDGIRITYFVPQLVTSSEFVDVLLGSCRLLLEKGYGNLIADDTQSAEIFKFKSCSV